MKRRIIQPQINQSFVNRKNNHADVSHNLAVLFNDTDCTRGLNRHFSNGAQKSTTPFRSLNRVNSLLKASPYSAQYGQAKLVETAPNTLDKWTHNIGGFDMSKPSSATTANTKATTVYDYENKKDKTQKKRDTKKQGKKGVPEKIVCKAGTKRPAQLKLDHMEYFTRMQATGNPKSMNIKLFDKKTGQEYDYPMFHQKQLKGFNASEIIRDFDMTKLEVEYDYDTDAEQQRQSKRMLLHELSQAIDFYVRDEPLKLITNVLI